MSTFMKNEHARTPKNIEDDRLHARLCIEAKPTELKNERRRNHVHGRQRYDYSHRSKWK